MGVKDFIARDLTAYATDRERAAYRAGMSSAAAICDALKAEIVKDNTSQRGRLTKTGASLAMIAEIAGDRITEVRETVSIDETPQEAAHRKKMELVNRILR